MSIAPKIVCSLILLAVANTRLSYDGPSIKFLLLTGALNSSWLAFLGWLLVLVWS